ncbi:uncharacterized protein [Eucyclogobius newberryi]|uniref:uncharacterized protein n=1 Tax=Eucyclogobius newberryi TaxID=166745 RepID=UPI003B5AA699
MGPGNAVYSIKKVWRTIHICLALLCYGCITRLTQAEGLDVLKELGLSKSRTGLASLGSCPNGVTPFRSGVVPTPQAALNTNIPGPFNFNNLSLVFTPSAHQFSNAFNFSVLSKEWKMQFGIQLSPGVVSIHVGQGNFMWGKDLHNRRWHNLAVNIEGQLVSEVVEALDPEGFFLLGRNNYCSSPFEGAICQFEIHPSAMGAQIYCDDLNEQCRQADTFPGVSSPLPPPYTDPKRTEILPELSSDYTFISHYSSTTMVSTVTPKMLKTTITHQDLNNPAPSSGNVLSQDHQGLNFSRKYQTPLQILKETEQDQALQTSLSTASLRERQYFETNKRSSPVFVADNLQLESIISLHSASGQDAKATLLWLSSPPAAEVESTHISLLVGPPGQRGDPGPPAHCQSSPTLTTLPTLTFFRLIVLELFLALKQEWANYGPRATCGPFAFIMRLAKHAMVLLVHMEDQAPLALPDKR